MQSTCVNVDGLPMHYRASVVARTGTPIVLVPGLVISIRYMMPLGEILAQRHSVFAVDLPGFGGSAAPPRALTIPELARAVERWMSAVGIERCHLVANSMGCQIAAHIAAHSPERVATVTLIGATIDPKRHRLSIQLIALLRDACREPARLWFIWIADFFRAGMIRAIATARAMFADHIEEQLPRMRAPLLVIRGGSDPTMPARWGEEAARLAPHGRVIEIPGEPHCVHFTAPERVAISIEQSIASASEAGLA